MWFGSLFVGFGLEWLFLCCSWFYSVVCVGYRLLVCMIWYGVRVSKFVLGASFPGFVGLLGLLLRFLLCVKF